MYDLIEHIIANGDNFACFSESCKGIDCIDRYNKPQHWATHRSEIEHMLWNLRWGDYNYMSIVVARTNMAGLFKVFVVDGSAENYNVHQLNVYPYSKEMSYSRFYHFHKGRFAPSWMITYSNRCLGIKHACVNQLFNLISFRGQDFKREYSEHIINRNINLMPGLDEFKKALAGK